MTASGPKRVLIVEAQRLIAADLELTLQKLGYDVVGSVDSGEEAVEKAISSSPDLVLMGPRLKGAMDGIQAATAISKSLDIPIVHLTAYTDYTDDAAIRRAMITGPLGYVLKPFDERDLRATLEIAIYKHETHRALAEERARREAAEKFQRFVEQVEDYAIVLMDVDGRVVSWNAGAQRIQGYEANEVIGEHFSLFYSPEDRRTGKPEQALEAAREMGHSEDELWLSRKDGVRFLANVIVSARRDERDKLIGFASVTRDITQRARAKVALEEYAVRMSAMVAAALDAIISIDLDGKVLEWNPAAERLFGYSRAEALGKRMGDLIIPEHLRGQHEEGLARCKRTGEGPILGKHLEMPAITRSGDELVIELSIVKVPGETPPIFTGFIRDIGERKAIEQEKARLYREAQQAIRARDEFLAIASHELRTPLSALVLQLATLERSLREIRNEAVNSKLVTKVAKASKITERLARLIERLLDVSRIATGRLQLSPEPMNLSDVVREFMDRFASDAQRAGSRLQVQIAPGATGEWDRMRLEQVLSNLLSNALKYGSGSPIEVKLDVTGDRVELTVRDHGIGISAADVSRIFDRFERAVPSRHYGGLGLGLYITRQIVEAHGGQIRVTSVPGNGSTFIVELPRRARVRENVGRRAQPAELGQ